MLNDLTSIALVILASAGLSAVFVTLLFPLMQRYALARPNARSSHNVPTPQGGGIAVMGATVAVVTGTQSFGLAGAMSSPDAYMLAQAALLNVLLAAVGLAVVGAVDDIRPLSPVLRLALQLAAAATVVATLPPSARVLPDAVPFVLERGLLIIGTVWFVNLVNFMDGIDGMTVAEGVPVAFAGAVCVTLAGLLATVPLAVAPLLGVATLIAWAIGGALLGFWPFNMHRARLFLGDVGSLPVGLLLAWVLIVLAAAGHLVAALIVPLYYLADATLTLVWRFRRGEKVWEAHRRHFYQRAVDSRRLTAPQVTRRVWLANTVLALLAVATIWIESALFDACALLLAGVVVAGLLQHFRRGVA